MAQLLASASSRPIGVRMRIGREFSVDLPDRCRRTDDHAFKTSSRLYASSISSGPRLADCKAVCDMLDVYTRDHAVKDSTQCARRIEYLSVPEPLPMIEDSSTPPFHGRIVRECPR